MITQKSPSKTLVLLATNDYGATHRYELNNDQGVFVGKSSNCGLQLHDNKLADIHCRIGMEDGKLRIQNWMLAEGTMINGREISAEQEVGPLDVIQVGSHRIRIAKSAREADAMAPETVHETNEHAPSSSHQVTDSGRNQDEKCTTDDKPSLGDCDTESLLESPTASLLIREIENESSCERERKAASSLDNADEDDLKLQLDIEPESMDLDVDFFSIEEEETYDRETVALLQAEIDDLRAALAQRDADQLLASETDDAPIFSSQSEATDELLARMQELIEEANRSDERVAILEEMLHAAEDANRSEREERNQLDAWVRDIEARIGQREEEHAAELDALKLRLQESSDLRVRMQKQLRQSASSGSASANKQYEEILEKLQAKNQELEENLAESQKKCLSFEHRLKAAEGGQDELLRAERAKLAQEQAKVSRMRYELSSKLAEIEELPKAQNKADQETGQRIRALREHLREIHEQEKHEVKETTLATRLASLWKRVEY